MVEGAAVLLEQAVGLIKEPAESNGRYPKQVANSEAQVERLASGLPRHVLYDSLHFVAQASDVGVGDAVGAAVEVVEHAVGLTKDPSELNGTYPKQPEYSEAQ